MPSPLTRRDKLVIVIFDHGQAWAKDKNGGLCKCGLPWTFGHMADMIMELDHDE